MVISLHRSRWLSPSAAMAAFILLAQPDWNFTWATEPDPIAWREDYSTALEEARAANRPLWIQFTGPWCPNCTRMEQESLPHPAVVQRARESFIPLKLRSDVHEQLALTFNLSALPATIIVAPNRDVVALHQGYLGPAEFDAFLRDSLLRVPGQPARDIAPNRGVQEKPPGDESKPLERLALQGYCAVSLVRDRKLILGLREQIVRHEGLIYRFASPAMQELFKAQPERYAPVNQGSCPVTQIDSGKTQVGDPRWGVIFQSRLFVFANDDARKRFRAEPERYAMADVAEAGFCAHCIRDSGLLVRGYPTYELARGGRRYWFPDETHRVAFLASDIGGAKK
jgi:YHS domain-containing protein